MPQPESRGDFVPQNAVKIYETVDGSEILKKKHLYETQWKMGY